MQNLEKSNQISNLLVLHKTQLWKTTTIVPCFLLSVTTTNVKKLFYENIQIHSLCKFSETQYYLCVCWSYDKL